MRASWSISSKHALISASSTQLAPRLAATRIASSAWWADRFGRNPKLTGEKSASKIGSITNLAAVMTTRSATVGTVASYCLLASELWGLGIGGGWIR